MAEESSRAWKDQYLLRFPDGLRDRIKAVAETKNRSMNAEIVATLQRVYPDPDAPITAAQFLEMLEAQLLSARYSESFPEYDAKSHERLIKLRDLAREQAADNPNAPVMTRNRQFFP